MKYPDCDVNLTGVDGNIFSIIAVVSKQLKRYLRENYPDDNIPAVIDEFYNDVTSSGSYSEALSRIMNWVNVEMEYEEDYYDEEYC